MNDNEEIFDEETEEIDFEALEESAGTSDELKKPKNKFIKSFIIGQSVVLILALVFVFTIKIFLGSL